MKTLKFPDKNNLKELNKYNNIHRIGKTKSKLKLFAVYSILAYIVFMLIHLAYSV